MSSHINVVPMSVREVEAVATNPLWAILQNWYDRQPVEPSWRKVAKKLGVVQSTFDTWRAPTEMPRRRNLWAIHDLTGVPYKTVVDAAVEAVGLYDPARAERAARDHEARKTAKRVKAVTSGESGEVPPSLDA